MMNFVIMPTVFFDVTGVEWLILVHRCCCLPLLMAADIADTGILHLCNIGLIAPV